jgi:hypothetical protein
VKLPNQLEFSLSANVGLTYREDFEPPRTSRRALVTPNCSFEIAQSQPGVRRVIAAFKRRRSDGEPEPYGGGGCWANELPPYTDSLDILIEEPNWCLNELTTSIHKRCRKLNPHGREQAGLTFGFQSESKRANQPEKWFGCFVDNNQVNGAFTICRSSLAHRIRRSVRT